MMPTRPGDSVQVSKHTTHDDDKDRLEAVSHCHENYLEVTVQAKHMIV